MTLSDQIQERKDALSHSDVTIAEGCGLSQASVKNYRSGASYPKPDNLKKICDFLGIENPEPDPSAKRSKATVNVTEEVVAGLERLNWTHNWLSDQSGVSYPTMKRIRDGLLVTENVAEKIREALKDGSSKPTKESKAKTDPAVHDLTLTIKDALEKGWTLTTLCQSGVSYDTVRAIRDGKLVKKATADKILELLNDEPPAKTKLGAPVKKPRIGKKYLVEEVTRAITMAQDSGDPDWCIVVLPMKGDVDIRVCVRPKQQKKLPAPVAQEDKKSDRPTDIGLGDLHA